VIEKEKALFLMRQSSQHVLFLVCFYSSHSGGSVQNPFLKGLQLGLKTDFFQKAGKKNSQHHSK